MSDLDLGFVQRAVALALEAEQAGNLPVGALLVLAGEVVAEGRNALLLPAYQPGNHAEIMAIRAVDPALWPRAREMTCYTTLEPCLMCYGTLLLHGVGRIVFGADDPEGGFRFVESALPPYYSGQASAPEWRGPLAAASCDPLYQRARARFVTLPCGHD